MTSNIGIRHARAEQGAFDYHVVPQTVQLMHGQCGHGSLEAHGHSYGRGPGMWGEDGVVGSGSWCNFCTLGAECDHLDPARFPAMIAELARAL